jgi:hypothetical protein
MAAPIQSLTSSSSSSNPSTSEVLATAQKANSHFLKIQGTEIALEGVREVSHQWRSWGYRADNCTLILTYPDKKIEISYGWDGMEMKADLARVQEQSRLLSDLEKLPRT